MAVVKDIDHGMKSIRQLIKQIKNTNIKVGVFAGAVNSKSAGKSKSKTAKTQYVADYAIANEYGHGHIPERSFIRSTVEEQKDKWSGLMSDVLYRATSGNADNQATKSGIYKVGAVARSDIIAKIDSNINPPNSPATIAKKGAHKNKTLIDDGVLRTSIEARIGDK